MARRNPAQRVMCMHANFVHSEEQILFGMVVWQEVDTQNMRTHKLFLARHA